MTRSATTSSGDDVEMLVSQGESFVFGCRAQRLVTLSALRVAQENYVREAVHRQVELLSCLANPGDDRFTYDLRLISRPNPGLYTRGSIDLVLLCRVDRATAAEAAEQARELLRLLQSTIIEVDWSMVPREQLRKLFMPFEARALVSITRRCQLLALDSIQTPTEQPTVGFGTLAPVDSPSPASGTAFHIFPFLRTFASHARLFRQLLLHRHPVLLSARLRPTRLAPEEARYLEEQIAQCEKHAQLRLGTPSDEVGSLRPTLQRRSQLLEQYFLRALHTLGDDAAVVTFDLASPAPIPRGLVEAVGHFISEPAAVPSPSLPGSSGLERFLAGGYETVVRDGDAAALEALKTLAMAPASPPGVPPEAHRLPHLFEPGEAVAAFRFPLADLEVFPGIAVRRSRYGLAPPELDQAGSLVGTSGLYGARQEVRLAEEDRLRHLYVVGQTGTGKTTLLRTMILDDMRAGAGLCVIDPHGDLYTDLLGLVPEERIDDVILIDPSDFDQPVAINLLEHEGETQRYFIVQEIVGIMRRLLVDQYGSASQHMVGPVFFEHLRNNLLLVMSHPTKKATIRDFFDLFNSPTAWMKWRHDQITDPQLLNWVKHVLPNLDYTKRATGEISLGEYVGSKFQEFVFDPTVSRIFDQPRSSFDFGEIMDEGRILLVNLSKGLLSEQTSRFLGMVILGKLLAAAMARVRRPAGERRPFFAYVDEFHTLATTSFVSMLSEGRKFGLGLVLANQFVSQLESSGIVDSIFGNVGSVATFRLGQKDAARVASLMAPVFGEADLVRLPNWQAAMVALYKGQTLEPFSVETVPPSDIPDPIRAEWVRGASRAAHFEHFQAGAEATPPEPEPTASQAESGDGSPDPSSDGTAAGPADGPDAEQPMSDEEAKRQLKILQAEVRRRLAENDGEQEKEEEEAPAPPN